MLLLDVKKADSLYGISQILHNSLHNRLVSKPDLP